LYLFRAQVRSAQAAMLWSRFSDLNDRDEFVARIREVRRESAGLEAENGKLVAAAREDVETALRIRPRAATAYVLLGNILLMNYSSGQAALIREPDNMWATLEAQTRHNERIRREVLGPAE